MDSSNNQNVCAEGCGGCKCNCYCVAPVAIMLIGVTVLLQTFNVLTANVANIIWPILLIIAGGAKLCKCCKKCCK